MIGLWDLFSIEDYQAGVDAGLIKTQKHPELPLWIHNYTQAAMYTKGAWDNKAVRRCRGIITDVENRVIARPFEKFFNYNQREAKPVSISADVVCLDKIDGSLGILYPTGSSSFSAGLEFPEYAIATRGSFASEQAIHATQVWEKRYASRWNPDTRYTFLFEIVYPENRIVVDYGDKDDLILLGAVDIKTGAFRRPGQAPSSSWWPGPNVKAFEFRTLKEALEAPPRPNAEGMVVIFTGRNKMVKIKQDDYLELHRLVTGLNPRRIWEFMAVNACQHLIEKPKHWASYLGLDPARADEIVKIGPDWRKDFLENVPDEFLDWVNTTIDEIRGKVIRLISDWNEEADKLRSEFPERKDFFQSLKDHPYRGQIGLLYDFRDVTTAAWREAYPEAERPFVDRNEDVA